MRVPALHVVPLKAKTRPMESTARQKVVVGHETAVRPEASEPVRGASVAMETGAEKPVPFQVRTAPLLSTRTQNVVEAQETEFSWPWLSSVARLGPGRAVEDRGSALGGHAEGRGHARDLVGRTPGADVAGPAAAVVGERVPLAVDRDAERGARAVDRRDALRGVAWWRGAATTTRRGKRPGWCWARRRRTRGRRTRRTPRLAARETGPEGRAR